MWFDPYDNKWLTNGNPHIRESENNKITPPGGDVFSQRYVA